MPKYSLRDRLQHILDAIAAIERYTAGKTLADFLADSLIRDGVERNIERISEASRFIPDDYKAAQPTTDWRNIAAIGNVLRHDYPNVVQHRIWKIVTEQLGSLRTVVESMAADLDKAERG